MTRATRVAHVVSITAKQRAVLEAGVIEGYASGSGFYPVASFDLGGVKVTATVNALIKRRLMSQTIHGGAYGGPVSASITEAGRLALAEGTTP
jgi:hypothetical protein